MPDLAGCKLRSVLHLDPVRLPSAAIWSITALRDQALALQAARNKSGTMPLISNGLTSIPSGRPRRIGFALHRKGQIAKVFAIVSAESHRKG